MTHHNYMTKGTCSRMIEFDLEDGKLRGNTCGNRPTSCADQLSRAIDKAFAVEA